MSYININKLKDLDKIIADDIYISGQKILMAEEVYNNMWIIDFSSRLKKKCTIHYLNNFLDRLIKKRTEQIAQLDIKVSAKFYMWFDEQTYQIRFNLISGIHEELPFGCTQNIISQPDSIFKRFLTESIENMVFEYCEAGEFDDIDSDENDPKDYILDIYYIELDPHGINKAVEH